MSVPQSQSGALKAPFPAFGGKSRVAAEVWRRLGDVRNFIEPFTFSAAVLLRRPGGAGPIETINDLNAYVSNFWRAVQRDPEAVAAHADWPVNETDLHARHRWLVTSELARHKLQQVADDPDAYDARMAGWWAWGACCWIGSGWCETLSTKIIHVGDSGQGVNGPSGWSQRPQLEDSGGRGVLGNSEGISQKMPFIGDRTKFGRGVQAFNPEAFAPDDTHRPQLADAFTRGRGVNSNDSAGTCATRRAWLTDWMQRLADRLRPVRVCCGHWARVCDSDSTMTRLGLTGVFLDPPYRKSLACGKKNRSAHIYANDKSQDVNALCDEVQAWCVKWGDNPQVRIALCGYEGEYPDIEGRDGWQTFAWKAQGGYGNRTKGGKENAERERVWFSPACITPATAPVVTDLFSEVA